MASQEFLCSANNVSNYHRGAQGEDDMLIVRVQNQTLIHLACKEEMS